MIVSGGELVLSDATPTYTRSTYYPQTGIGLVNLFAHYGTIYEKQEDVYTVVRKRALATRRLPLKVYLREPTGRSEQRDSPYAQLLRTPNPRMSGAFLWEWTSSTYDVYGEAIWLKVRGRDGKPAQVWPIHPSNIAVQVVADADMARQFSQPIGSLLYVYSLGGAVLENPQFVAAERDVIHFKTYNPKTTTRGLSPLEPLRQTLINEDATRRASTAFWSNGARPSGFLSSPKALSPEAMARLKAQWDAIHGSVDNFGKWAVLEEGMEPKVLSLSAEDAQYIESRKLNREEVCMVYDVPPPVVHILDRATFSNITEQMRSMYRDTMAPHLGGLEAALDFQLRPDFGDDDLYAEFLMDEVLRGDFEQRVDAYQKGINSGWITPAEVRGMENLPPIAGSDRLFVNATLIPIDEVSSRTTPNPPAEIIPQNEPSPPVAPPDDQPGSKALTVREFRSVMGRLGRVADLDDIDIKALTAGISATVPVIAALGVAGDVDDFKARLRALIAEEAA